KLLPCGCKRRLRCREAGASCLFLTYSLPVHTPLPPSLSLFTSPSLVHLQSRTRSSLHCVFEWHFSQLRPISSSRRRHLISSSCALQCSTIRLPLRLAGDPISSSPWDFDLLERSGM